MILFVHIDMNANKLCLNQMKKKKKKKKKVTTRSNRGTPESKAATIIISCLNTQLKGPYIDISVVLKRPKKFVTSNRKQQTKCRNDPSD